MKIGIDIGGVIISRGNDNEDTSLFGDNYLNAKPVAGAIEALEKLNKEIFKGEVYIVSKCGHKIETRSRDWLKANLVHLKTGIPEANVHFCRERADKAPIARKLGLTHFVDDRLEVLSYMRGIVKERLLFAPESKGLQQWGWQSGPVILAFTWKDVLEWVSAPKQGEQTTTAEKLRDFFITRQEFEFARAVMHLEKIRNEKSVGSDFSFLEANSALEQLTAEQRLDKAGDLKWLIDQAKKIAEKV